jgi:hypothetical protein
MNDIALTIVTLLAQDPPRQTGPDFGKASPFGLLVLVLLLIGTFGLVWSMNRHLRKLPKSFDEPDEQAGEESGKPVDDGESKRESG